MLLSYCRFVEAKIGCSYAVGKLKSLNGKKSLLNGNAIFLLRILEKGRFIGYFVAVLPTNHGL